MQWYVMCLYEKLHYWLQLARQKVFIVMQSGERYFLSHTLVF